MNKNNGLYSHGGNLEAAARCLGISPFDLLDFSASINPLGPPAGVRQAVQESFDRWAHYPPEDGSPLAVALARRLGMPDCQILPGNGSTELIYLLPRALDVKRALLVTPAFSEYRRALEQVDAQIDAFPLDPERDFDFDPVRLLANIRPGTDLVVLANPGSPSGVPIPPSAIEAVVGSVAEGTVVLVDEAFVDFCPEFSVLDRLAAFSNLVVLRSLTKFYAIPGLRAGYVCGSGELVERLRQVHVPWSLSVPAMAAAEACLADTAYCARTLQLVPELRADLVRGLERFGLKVFPSAANYLLVRLPPGRSARELAEKLLAMRVLIRDCANFPPLDPSYFRVAVRTARENAILLRSLSQVLEPVA